MTNRMIFFPLMYLQSRRSKFLITAFCCLFMILTGSCVKNNSGINQAQQRINSYFNKETNADSVFIIPATGCSGCINKAVLFAQKHQASRNRFYFVTNIDDLKLLKNQLGIEPNNEGNFHFDNNNVLSGLGYKDIYPYLYIRRDRILLSVRIITPDFYL